MRLKLILLGALLTLSSCKGKEYSAEKTVSATSGEAITISAKSVDDTSIAWAARAVGWESKKGFVLSMTVGQRPTIILEHLSDAEEAPTKAQVEELVSMVKTGFSPDGQHLLVSWKSEANHEELFHLLPKGSPFQLNLPGHKKPSGENPDWAGTTKSEQLALQALAIAAADPKKCRIPGGRYFWAALEGGAPGSPLESPLLDLWPACAEARIPISNINRNSKLVSPQWSKTLYGKVDQCLKPEASEDDFGSALRLIVFMKDTQRLEAIAPRLIEQWPDNYTIKRQAMLNFEDFPEKIRKGWLDKAMAEGTGNTFEQRARYYRFMKKWSDCKTFHAYVKAHPNLDQKRKDCPGWPLKRFPAEGPAREKLDSLLKDNKRSDAITLIIRTTGWEYGDAVYYVNQRTEQPAPKK